MLLTDYQKFTEYFCLDKGVKVNLIFQTTTLKREPLEISVIYTDLDDLKIKEYPTREELVIKNIIANLSNAIIDLFNQLDLFSNTDVIQITVSLASGSIQFLFKDKDKIYNSKLFDFTNTNKEIAVGLKTVSKILINQVRKTKKLKELELTDLFKTEIGVMSKQEIKDVGMYGKGLDYWTDKQVEKERVKAQKHIDKLLKDKPHLYKKGKGIDD